MSPFEDNASNKIIAKSGHAAIFSFPAISSEPAPSVSWQSDDHSLLYGTKYAVTSDNRLVILSVDSSDEKMYRARATNTQLGQEENSEFIQLVVDTSEATDVAPEIIVPPDNITIVRHTPVTELQCIANARPLYELELTWFKDGRPVEETGIPYSFNDLWNRTLSLLSADFVHNGVYTCRVRMRTGGPTLTASAEVKVIEKPNFTDRMKFESLGEIGKSIEIPCSIVGEPKPNITWYRDAKPLSELPALRYTVHENGSLYIR